MAAPANGHRLALCLSGGGFRASLYHLGVLHRLNELGVLEKVATISSVSGGSILSGYLAKRIIEGALPSLAPMPPDEWTQRVSEPFRAFVSHDRRTLPCVKTFGLNVLWPDLRVRQMIRTYDDFLEGAKLVHLPESPRFVFCATDLVFGVNFTFHKRKIGDYKAGYAPTPAGMPIALAVAASACFPPLFGPMGLDVPANVFTDGDYEGSDRDDLVANLALSDGGVYDNMGMEPALKGHDSIIVSDCGAPFDFAVKKLPLRKLLRYTAVVMNQVGALRKRLLFRYIDPGQRVSVMASAPAMVGAPAAAPTSPDTDAEAACLPPPSKIELHEGAYLALWSDAAGYPQTEPAAAWKGYPDELVKGTIANIRTDLDRFTAAEQCILENHGYSLADAAVRSYLRHMIEPNALPYNPPYPQWTDGELLRTALKNSHKRFCLQRMLGKE